MGSHPDESSAASQPSVHLVGALDTKGDEYAFVRDRLQRAGAEVVILDTGIVGAPTIFADIPREAVAEAAGTSLEQLVHWQDRGRAVSAMAEGAARLLSERERRGDVAGVLVLGGSNAGFVMSRIAETLPLGLPKVLVSTVAAGDTRPYVGTSDLIMFNPVVDIAGLNTRSIPVLAKAADAIIGMLNGADVAEPAFPGLAIGCTMFGVTTGCVSAVQSALESLGDQVQVFHATGTGGRAYEALVDAGAFDLLIDITTTELADDLVGGVCSAGPNRLTAAVRSGIPQIVSVGALDLVNFGPRESVPSGFARRRLHAHNPAVTLMRTNPEENGELGRRLAHKLNASTGFVEVHVPAGGFSQISVEGAPFYDPEADASLIRALRTGLDDRIPLFVHDVPINDSYFAAEILAAADRAKRSLQKGN